mgnify:CR=1 FL=1
MQQRQMIQRSGSAEKELLNESSETHSLVLNVDVSPPSCDGSWRSDSFRSESYSKLDKSRQYSGSSISPQMFTARRWFRNNVLDPPQVKVAISCVALLGIPLIAYGSFFPAYGVPNYIIAIWSAWDGLLSISSFLVLGLTIPAAFWYVELERYVTPPTFASLPGKMTDGSMSPPKSRRRSSLSDSQRSAPGSTSKPNESDLTLFPVEACCSHPKEGFDFEEDSFTFRGIATKAQQYAFSSKRRLFHSVAFVHLSFLLFTLGVVGPNSLVYPSWLWHPFLWGSYHVYDINAIGPAMENICIDPAESFCLSEKEWNVLSTGKLSSRNSEDVRAVSAGLTFARENSIVINVLARDIVTSIPALRINVESLVPIFKRVAVVVFENDSEDGTREEFKTWASEVEGLEYTVDLMECEGVEDCKLGRRYRDRPDVDYDYSSEVGEMDVYRNLAFDYIRGDPKYTSFSHVMVLDVDLGVPISPLGILHTLGLRPDFVVASSGRQPWPTAFGSLITPYDLNGFREHNEANTMGLEIWHQRFCSIQPLGERWWSECDALAPTHLVAILWNDRKLSPDDFYRVDSAFNGAVLYPLDLLRKSNATYNKGTSQQRCEHVGLHAQLNELKPMYVDKKWDMHLMPNSPGGAAWGRAKKASNRIFTHPKLLFTILFTHAITVGVYVWATFTIGVFVIVPCWLRLSLFLSKQRQALPTLPTTRGRA